MIVTPLDIMSASYALMAAHPGKGFTLAPADNGTGGLGFACVWDDPTLGDADAAAAFQAWASNSFGRSQAAQIVAIQAKRDSVLAGFTYNGHPCALSGSTQSAIASIIAFFQNENPPDTGSISFEFDDATYVSMSSGDMLTFGRAAAGFVQAAFANSATLIDATRAAADLTAMQAVDINLGWPG